jgi:LCP family protein required for cell wall assembly
MSAPSVGRSGPPLFAVAAFWAFVLGGIVFGVVFVVNWRVLSVKARERADSTSVTVSAGPVTVSLPVAANPPSLEAPAKPAEISTGLATIVKNALPDWSGTERINILLLGIDKRDDEPIAGTRSDTMILASIDPQTKSASLVSIPRDLWVDIPGCTAREGCSGGQQRINVAHAVGGADMARATVTADFGVPIDFWARVDFRGFEQLVDAVGGVVIDVDWPVKDDEYPTEDYGYQRIYFGPGPQLMDGRKALMYARSRHGTSDFSRAGRQQKVIVGLRNRAIQFNMLSRAPELLGIVQRSLNTDLTPVQMLALAKLMSQIEQDHITNLVLDATYVTPFRGLDGAYLLRPNTPAIRAAIAEAQRSAAEPGKRTASGRWCRC